MKKYLFLIFLLSVMVIPCSHIIADGPPVKPDGTITQKYIPFKLTNEQIEEVGRTRILTLNKTQVAVLRKLSKVLPEKLPILTPYYNDCSCDTLYLIWNKKSSVGLLTEEIKNFEEIYQYYKKTFGYQKVLDNWTTGQIIIDSLGDLYYDTKKINTNDVEVLVKDKVSKKVEEVSLILNYPPYINKEINKKIKSVTDELRRSFSASLTSLRQYSNFF